MVIPKSQTTGDLYIIAALKDGGLQKQMSIIVICGSCAFSIPWHISEEDFKNFKVSNLICDIFPDGIPNHVEEGGDCNKFKEKIDALD